MQDTSCYGIVHMIAAKNIVRTAAPLKDVMVCMNVEGVGTELAEMIISKRQGR